jgi:hypothetical protein
MEGFSFVTPVTGLNGPNTGKEDDDGDGTLSSPHPCMPHVPPTSFSLI